MNQATPLFSENAVLLINKKSVLLLMFVPFLDSFWSNPFFDGC